MQHNNRLILKESKYAKLHLNIILMKSVEIVAIISIITHSNSWTLRTVFVVYFSQANICLRELPMSTSCHQRLLSAAITSIMLLGPRSGPTTISKFDVLNFCIQSTAAAVPHRNINRFKMSIPSPTMNFPLLVNLSFQMTKRRKS